MREIAEEVNLISIGRMNRLSQWKRNPIFIQDVAMHRYRRISGEYSLDEVTSGLKIYSMFCIVRCIIRISIDEDHMRPFSDRFYRYVYFRSFENATCHSIIYSVN